MNLRPSKKTLGKIVKEGACATLLGVAPIAGISAYIFRTLNHIDRDKSYASKLLHLGISAIIAFPTGGLLSAYIVQAKIPEHTIYETPQIQIIEKGKSNYSGLITTLAESSPTYYINYPELEAKEYLGTSTNNWQEIAKVQLDRIKNDNLKNVSKSQRRVELINNYMRNLK